MADASRQHGLDEYNARRDFRKTPEPKGHSRKSGKKNRSFVVQKHDASRLHYDFRLEHDGVLKSWAVAKGPSLDTDTKRLAIRTEDHPLDYGSFEGVIPKGEYGGGTVMLWDCGDWEPQNDPDEGLKEGKLKFTLHGERMKGGWTLVRMKRRPREKRENWLLIKERDEEAQEDEDRLTSEFTESVQTGRTMDEIASGGDVWTNSRKKPDSARSSDNHAGSVKLPGFVKPQLATLVDTVPDGDDWLHEIKYDGYRAVTSTAGGKTIIRTRNGHDWSEKFTAIAGALNDLPAAAAQFDGEIAVADEKGHTDFGALQNALADGDNSRMRYYIFDLLSLNGEDLKKSPLLERKQKLKSVLSRLPKISPLSYCDHIEGSGGVMYDHACKIQLEGIISKKADAPYRSGRTRSWLKIKCGMGQEFVIIGWRPSDKKGRPFSSLLLGVRDGKGELRYCGRVGSGFGDREFDQLWPKLKSRARKTPPADDIPRDVRKDAKYVTPELVAEIEFRGWTRQNYVRQGSFKGLRQDKSADEIIKERETVMSGAKRSAGNGRTSSENGAIEIERVRVTHPDRVLFPSQGATKQDLIDHYLSVADQMLPHVAGRPLSLVRCPKGREGDCFYQKHASPGFPEAFKAIEIDEKSGKGEYLYIEDVSGLVAAVQMGVLEIHIWPARRDRLDRPDRLVFDLDPDEEIGFDAVKAGASELHERLSDIGLESFLLATGGKGLHVVVPHERRHGWEEHKTFAEAVARMMAEDSPERYVATMSKARRKGKVFIDYFRNDRGSTAIAPFSTRAREGAPVAFPLSWGALGSLEDARSVRIGDAADRLKRYRSRPWGGYFEVRQRLPSSG